MVKPELEQKIQQLERRSDNLEQGLFLALKAVKAILEMGKRQGDPVVNRINEVLDNIDERNKRPIAG